MTKLLVLFVSAALFSCSASMHQTSTMRPSPADMSLSLKKRRPAHAKPTPVPTVAPTATPAPSVASISVPAISGTNRVLNPSFESGLDSWADWGNSTVVSSGDPSRLNVLQVGTGPGGRGQLVQPLVSGATYTIQAVGRVSVSGEIGYVGVHFLDSNGKALQYQAQDGTWVWMQDGVGFDSTADSVRSKVLTLPPGTVALQVWAWKEPGAGGYFYADDIRLFESWGTSSVVSDSKSQGVSISEPRSPSSYSRAFYVDATLGSDSNDGRSPQSAWKTLDKVTAVSNTFRPGDGILFKSGETYPGSFRIEYLGTASQPITISRYGAGNRPVMTGFVNLGGWVNLGNGIWEASCPSCGSTVNVVTLDDASAPLGRYPKLNAANGGYLTIASHSGPNSITDPNTVHPMNWTGGEIVLRKNHWIIDRATITGHSGSTFTFGATSPAYPVQDRFGYFIQNHPGTLTEYGEWAYMSAQKKIRMFFGQENPANHTVKASAVDVIGRLSNLQFITIDQIAFEGANTTAIDVNYSAGITIQDASIRDSGFDGISGMDAGQFTLRNSLISDSGSNGLSLSNAGGAQVLYNLVYNSGAVAGRGRNADATYNGITIWGATDSVIQGNQVEHSGYCGISFIGERVLVKNNYVNHVDFVKDDGGGIYTYRSESVPYGGDRSQIIENIVINGPGAADGTDRGIDNWVVDGIYLDGHSANLDVIGNTVAFFRKSGIFFNSSNGSVADGNTLFRNGSPGLWDNGGQIAMSSAPPNLILRGALVYRNIFFSASPEIPALILWTEADDIAQFGEFDSNYYVSPNPAGLYASATYLRGGAKTYNQPLSLANWRTGYGKDWQSQAFLLPYAESDLNQNVRFEVNSSLIPRTLQLDGDYVDGQGVLRSGSVTIPPYGSIILIRK